MAVSVPVLHDYPPTMPNLLADAVRRFGDHELIVTAPSRHTFADIDRRSRLLARRLLAAGVPKGARIGVLFPQNGDWLTAFFGITRMGAVAVTLSTFAKPPEIRKLLVHSDLHLLVVPRQILSSDENLRLETTVPELAGQRADQIQIPEIPHLRAIWMVGGSDRSWATSVDFDADTDDAADGEGSRLASVAMLEAVERAVHPSDQLVIIYTSGTTSDPKGVIHSHGAWVRHGENLRRAGVATGGRILQQMPFFWIGGGCMALMAVMHSGATMVCQERFEPASALELIERERVTQVTGWATVLRALLEHPDRDKRDLTSCALFPKPGDPKSDPTLRHNSLGMTETCGPHTYGQRDQPIPERWRGSFGWPLPGIDLRIKHPETNEDLPHNTEGEVCIRSYSTLLGMVKRERHEVFDPDGFYHTGDKGYVNDDGLLIFKGRLSEMIKTRGNNVAPAEVEALLMGYPNVQFAFVMGIDLPDGDQDVGCVLIPVDGTTLDPTEIRAWAREQVASYKVPRRMIVLDKQDMAWLANEKPDKRAVTPLVAASPRLD